MSTLTKLLVVLLSLFTIFLCGMMIVFVGNSSNYKASYEEQNNLRGAAESALAMMTGQYEEQVKKSADLKTKLQQDIQNLESEKSQLAADKLKYERESLQNQADAERWRGVMAGFEQSVDNLQASLDQAQKQLDQARAQTIKDQKDLNQITATLYERNVQLENLESERRRLMEQNAALEKQLASAVVVSQPKEIIPVTPLNERATPAAAVTATDVKALITAVGESMVQLSVGSADGVTKGMVFHITRGDTFLCDVVITDIDINKCAGVLELVQQRPQVGDTASTQL